MTVDTFVDKEVKNVDMCITTLSIPQFLLLSPRYPREFFHLLIAVWLFFAHHAKLSCGHALRAGHPRSLRAT